MCYYCTRNFDMILITPDNADLLAEARVTIDGPFKDPQKLGEEVCRYCDGNRHRAYVVFERGQTIGYVEIKLREYNLPVGAQPHPEFEDYGHITRIGVRREHRRMGYGRGLLTEAEQWLQSQGKLGVWLDYHEDNLLGANLYSRAGYRDIDFFKDNDKDRLRRIAVKTW